MSEVKTVGRSKIIGMQVYGPDAVLIGTVKDVEFTLGEGKPFLAIETKHHTLIKIDWGRVSAVEDIVLLKEAIKVEAPPTTEALTQPIAKAMCPSCGKQATWIQQYKRWYCYNCKKYL